MLLRPRMDPPVVVVAVVVPVALAVVVVVAVVVVLHHDAGCMHSLPVAPPPACSDDRHGVGSSLLSTQAARYWRPVASPSLGSGWAPAAL